MDMGSSYLVVVLAPQRQLDQPASAASACDRSAGAEQSKLYFEDLAISNTAELHSGHALNHGRHRFTAALLALEPNDGYKDALRAHHPTTNPP
jgi:hypothetical protein